MAKPNLLQRALGRPSQRYAATATTTMKEAMTTTMATRTVRVSTADHRARDFHSTKKELLRIADELNNECHNGEHELVTAVADDHHKSEGVGFSNDDQHKNTKLVELEPFTLDSLPIPAAIQQRDDIGRNKDNEAGLSSLVGLNRVRFLGEEGGEDVFYTPAASPISSSLSSGSPVFPFISRLPKSPSCTSSLSATPSPPNSVSVSASSSVTSLPTTLPYTTAAAEAISAATMSRLTATGHVSAVRTPREKCVQVSQARKTTYTDEDWAKDVRWLVTPSKSNASPKGKSKDKKKAGSSSASIQPVSSTNSLTSPTTSPFQARSQPTSVMRLPIIPNTSSRPHLRSRMPKCKTGSKSSRTLVGMTVLPEVEEDPDMSDPGPRPLVSSSSRTNSLFGKTAHTRSQSLSYPPLHASRNRRDSVVSTAENTAISAPKMVRRRSSSFPSSVRPPRADPIASRSHKNSRSPSRPPWPLSQALSTSSQPSNVTKHSSISRATSGSTSTSATTRSPYTTAPVSVLDALGAHPHLDGVNEENALPSSGTRGFTGLVLPRATPSGSGTHSTSGRTWKWWKGKGTKGITKGTSGTLNVRLSVGLGMADEVDLTRAGHAQTTMASVEVVRGIAAAAASVGLGSRSLGRPDPAKRTSLFGSKWFGKSKDNNPGVTRSSSLARSGSKRSRGDNETPLGFTSYRAPPVYVGANSVLVQVWAVGLDGVDGRLVGVPMDSGSLSPLLDGGDGWLDGEKYNDKEKEKRKSPPVGYVPGRSFVGRVLEVGWEVRDESVKKGDWTMGLLGVGKCGALAEFIVVDRHRVRRIPNPVAPEDVQPLPLSSMKPRLSPRASPEPRRRISGIFPAGVPASSCTKPEGLTVEEFALLPLCGVTAYRAVRTMERIKIELAQSVTASTSGTSSNTIRPECVVYPGQRRSVYVHSPLARETSSDDSETDDVTEELKTRVRELHLPSAMASEHVQCERSDTRPRVLILRAHDGPGALAVQMMVKSGWSVWAHVPIPFELPGPAAMPLTKGDQYEGDCSNGRGEEGGDSSGEHEQELEKRRSILKRIEDRLRAWGAEQVLFVPTISLPSMSRFSTISTPAFRASLSSIPSIYYQASCSSSFTQSRNPSPSLFSRSSSRSSSPISSPYSHAFSSSNGLSSYSHTSSSMHQHVLPRPYTYTPLPLSPYTSEQTSIVALFSYLTHLRVRFDAILDTVGGRDVWQAGRVLLSLPVRERDASELDGQEGIESQFTTLVGDTPERIIPTAGDHFRAGVRSFRGGSSIQLDHVHWADTEDMEAPPTQTEGNKKKAKKSRTKPRQVSYAWVNIVSDVDWEGNGICDSLGAVLQQAIQDNIKPYVGPADFAVVSSKGKGRGIHVPSNMDDGTVSRVVPFERTPAVFVPGGGLEHGGTIISKIA